MNTSGKKKQKHNITEIKNQKKIYQFFTLSDKDKQNKIQDEDIEKQEKLLKKIQKQKENDNLENKNQELKQQQKKIQTKKIVVKKERETNNQKLKQKINNKQKNRYRKSSLLSQQSQNDEQAFQSQQIEIEDLLLDQDEELVYLAKQKAILDDINEKEGKQKQKNKKQQSKKGKKQKQINSEEQEIEEKNSDSEFEISLQKSNRKKGQKQQIQKQDKMLEESKNQNGEIVASNQNTEEDKNQEDMYIKQLQAQEIQENQRVTRRQTRAQNGINQERQQIFEYQEIQQQIPYQPRKKYVSQIEEQIQKMEEARGEAFDKDEKDKLRKDLQKQQDDELNKKLEKVEKQLQMYRDEIEQIQSKYNQNFRLQQLFDDIKMTKLQCLLKANEECKFSYVNPDRQYSLVRASYWESYQHLGEGSKVYQNRKGKNYHNWLCFKCYDAFEEAQEIIRQFLLAFADYKAKLVIHQVLEMNKRSGKVDLNQNQQQMNLFRKEILNEIFEFLA